MPWNCELLDIVGSIHKRWKPKPGESICGRTYLIDSSGKEYSLDDLKIGYMFYLPENIEELEWPWYLAKDDYISDYYKTNNNNRKPLFVLLPGKNIFLLDGKCWSNGKHYGGWQVTGIAPNITVTPSINIGGSYHGFLVNGIIGDDVEGRVF